VQKLTLGDPETQSKDVLGENLARVGALFPEAMAEGRIDFDVLRQLLGDVIEDREEKYGLSWPGKRRARQIALTPSTGTLRPCPDESVDWSTTQNLMIEGDNLEVLKLLQKSYAGKVKLIYIDPPYNTGKDFVYPDDFRDNLRNYLELTGQVDGIGRRISTNTEASGRFHTDWLNMMYPRLKLAHSLLTRDGAIFASCDEQEQPRLRLILDEVFGGENFVADMVWAAGRKNDSRLISVSHEYIVAYARDTEYLRSAGIEWRQRKKGLEEIYAQHDRLRRQHGSDYDAATEGLKAWYKGLPDGHPSKAHKHYAYIDGRGVYFPDNISWPGGGGPTYEVLHPQTRRPVTVPSRGWITPDPKKMQEWIDEGRVRFGPDERSVPTLKSYLRDREYQAPYSVFYQDGRAATKRLRELMGGDYFDFPKDEVILQELIEMVTSGEDVVLDCFAGSGTTGHAVLAQNSMDDGHRRYILVQLPEPLDSENKDQLAAAEFCDQLAKPRNIAELTKERLRRAGARIRDGNPMFAGDTGFRVYSLDSTNIQAWDPDREDLAGTLEGAVEHVKDGRTEQDILCELLLKLGLDLCVPSESRAIARKRVHAIGGGALLVCLDPLISRDDVEELANGIAAWFAQLAPAGGATCVFRDSAFEDDVAKTNLAAILAQRGLTRVRSL